VSNGSSSNGRREWDPRRRIILEDYEYRRHGYAWQSSSSNWIYQWENPLSNSISCITRYMIFSVCSGNQSWFRYRYIIRPLPWDRDGWILIWQKKKRKLRPWSCREDPGIRHPGAQSKSKGWSSTECHRRNSCFPSIHPGLLSTEREYGGLFLTKIKKMTYMRSV